MYEIHDLFIYAEYRRWVDNVEAIDCKKLGIEN